MTLILPVIYCAAAAQGQARRASVQGATHVNLRSGPGLSHTPITVLSENAPLIIEGQEGEWMRVKTADGQQGYVHQSLVKILDDDQKPTPAKESMAGETAVATVKTPQSSVPDTPPTRTKAPVKSDGESVSTTESAAESSPPVAASPARTFAEQKESKPAEPVKSPPLIHLLEGRESDMTVWLAIAVAFFLLGWICGGNFYLRRDRARRTKLRF